MLLAWRLKAASPDALHPGKAGEESVGKVYFPLRIFPAFLGQKPTNFRLPKSQADVAAFSRGLCSPSMGPGGLTPWRRSGGRSARKTCPWAGFQRRGRNARKMCRWHIFSGGRAAAPERPEGPGRLCRRSPQRLPSLYLYYRRESMILHTLFIHA